MTHTEESRRRPGRPRESGRDDAVVAAALELLLEHTSPSDVTIGDIVARSGTSKALIYRRWGSKEDLLAAALDSVRVPFAAPDTGSLLGDLMELYSTPLGETISRSMEKRVSLALLSPRLREAYWTQYVVPRREIIRKVFDRAVERGEVAPSINPDIVLDLIHGMGYYNLMVRPKSDDVTVDVSAALLLLWHGIHGSAGPLLR